MKKIKIPPVATFRHLKTVTVLHVSFVLLPLEAVVDKLHVGLQHAYCLSVAWPEYKRCDDDATADLCVISKMTTEPSMSFDCNRSLTLRCRLHMRLFLIQLQQTNISDNTV